MAVLKSRERVSSGRALFLSARFVRPAAAARHRHSIFFAPPPLKAAPRIPYPAPSAMRAQYAAGLALATVDC
jgi:hypothetical protein